MELQVAPGIWFVSLANSVPIFSPLAFALEIRPAEMLEVQQSSLLAFGLVLSAEI